MNKYALAFGIAIEQPPSTLPVEAQEYLPRVMIQISGQFAELSKDVEDLKARIAVLEGP